MIKFNKILLGIVVMGVSIYLLFSFFFKDVQINKYTNIDAIYDQKAIEQGWVPSILPLSAYEIVETHDIDTNILLGSFKYKEVDEANFINHLKKFKDDTFIWQNFLFKIDKVTNLVKYRNKPIDIAK